MGFIGTTIIFFTIITFEERLPINLSGIITLLFGRRLLEYGNIFLYAHTLFKKRYRLCVKGILDKLWTHVEKMTKLQIYSTFSSILVIDTWWLCMRRVQAGGPGQMSCWQWPQSCSGAPIIFITITTQNRTAASPICAVLHYILIGKYCQSSGLNLTKTIGCDFEID